MVILYVLLIAYILAINFYAYLLVKSYRDKEREIVNLENAPPPEKDSPKEGAEPTKEQTARPPERTTGKLCITGLLGGAITIYLCMFLMKYKRSDLLLMVIMPLLGVLNIYLWVLLFRSGFSFFILR